MCGQKWMTTKYRKWIYRCESLFKEVCIVIYKTRSSIFSVSFVLFTFLQLSETIVNVTWFWLFTAKLLTTTMQGKGLWDTIMKARGFKLQTLNQHNLLCSIKYIDNVIVGIIDLYAKLSEIMSLLGLWLHQNSLKQNANSCKSAYVGACATRRFQKKASVWVLLISNHNSNIPYCSIYGKKTKRHAADIINRG